MRVALGLALAVAACGLIACETAVDEALMEDPAYQLGYNDGCTTAHTGTGFSKPQRNKEYAGTRAYDAGWSAGFGGCGGDATAARRGDTWNDDNNHTGRSQ